MTPVEADLASLADEIDQASKELDRLLERRLAYWRTHRSEFPTDVALAQASRVTAARIVQKLGPRAKTGDRNV